jgi:hypothetical protein
VFGECTRSQPSAASRRIWNVLSHVTCLEAVLKYKRDHNWAQFPVPPGQKKSYKSARHSGGVQWGKTRDPDQLRKDWQDWPDAGPGLPCGADNKVWCVEADTIQGHGVDGVGNLRQLFEQHGGMPETLMSMSPSGSTAYFFQWPEGVVIKNSTSKIAPGVDVRGEGGMMVIPPAVHKTGERYVWLNYGTPIGPPPQWLVDAGVKAAPAHTFDASHDSELTADESMLAAAAEVIPNNYDWENWKRIGLAFWAATGGSGGGKKLWHAFSKKNEDKYDAAETDEQWAKITSCPPTSIGASTIFWLADRADPEWEARFVHGDADPVDLWNVFPLPPLPTGILPKVIEDYARDKAKLMGCDPAGLAMAALTVCAAAIPDKVKLKVKKHDTWEESTRLWTALVADPSGKKSPIISEAKRPFARINGELVRAGLKAKQEYDALSKEDKKSKAPPKQPCIMAEDVTIEAMQEVFKDSEDGVLVVRDELSGWFGSMDKYSGGKGALADRGFWLSAWNGVAQSFHRVGRGTGYMPNVSVSLLGGIQPDVMRQLIGDTFEDGLIQRINPIVLKPATVGTDAPTTDAEHLYSDLVTRLRMTSTPMFCPVTFAPEAMKIREALEQKHIDLMGCVAINKRLGAHLGKYDGIFARLCLLWHCIECPNPEVRSEVSADTARRAAAFLHDFLLPHALAFYADVVGLTDDHDNVTELADYILAHGLEKVTNREVARASKHLRKLDNQKEVEAVCFKLDSLCWLTRVPARKANSPAVWNVNERVHTKYADRGKQQRERREREKVMIKALCRR